MKRLNSEEEGIVSMIAVIIVSILLSIVALGLLRLTLDEQRGSTDLMLSTKAYYAAEAGVEDALYEIKTGSPTPNDCGPVTPVESTNTQYTCRLILDGLSSKNGKVTPQEAYQLDMLGSTLSQLRLQWNQDDVDSPASPSGFSFTSGVNPRTQQASPPIMRVEIVKVPAGSFDRDAITANRQVLYLRPTTSGGVATAAISLPNPSPYGAATIQAATCPNTPGNGYACSVTLTGFVSGNDYVLRLSTLYANGDTNFLLTALDGSGDPLSQGFFGTVIDVTAKANNVFRRVRYELPNSNQTSMLPFALLGGESLCFDGEVSITNNTVTSGGEDACKATPL